MGGFGSENGKDLQFFRQWDCFNRAIRKYLPVGKNQAQPTRPVGRICDLSSFDRSQPTPKTPQTPNRISPPKWDNEPRSRPFERSSFQSTEVAVTKTLSNFQPTANQLVKRLRKTVLKQGGF
jgi:hypothetical protein